VIVCGGEPSTIELFRSCNSRLEFFIAASHVCTLLPFFCGRLQTHLFACCFLWLCSCSVVPMGACRHGQEGSLALPLLWKCCKVFLCISSYSKAISRRIIIYALFLQTVVGFREQSPRSSGGSIPGPLCVTFVSRPLICPPLEKILRTPMVVPEKCMLIVFVTYCLSFLFTHTNSKYG